MLLINIILAWIHIKYYTDWLFLGGDYRKRPLYLKCVWSERQLYT